MTIEPQDYECFKKCMLFPHQNLKYVSTVAVMREFFLRKFDYLIFMGWFGCCDLVISKEHLHLDTKPYYTITMSEFKSLRHSLAFFNSINEIITKGLCKKVISESPGKVLYLLTSDYPALRAIATNDHHYGNEWNGKDSLILGERFGDTSSFPIIGIRLPSDYPLS